MTDSLALAYRPATFRDLVGQGIAQALLMRMVHVKDPDRWTPLAEPDVPPALLLGGQRGCGKTSSARILAAALNCTSDRERPCTSCPSCQAVADGTALAVTEVDAASNGGVAEVRKLRELVSYQAPGAAWRVVILDECHAMSKEAYHALLKVLEEPPPHTVFVLLTTETGKVLPTVVSRSLVIPFRRIPAAAIAQRLRYICRKEGIPADDNLLLGLAARSDGAMRDAVMALDLARRAGAVTWEQYQMLSGESDFAPGLLAACADGDHGAVFAALRRVLAERADFADLTAGLVTCLRDLLVVQSGAALEAEGAALEARRTLARRLDTPRVVAALRVLWDLRCKTSGDAQSSLELALVMISEKFHSQQAPASHSSRESASNGHHVMTVEEMAAAIRP